MAISNRGGSRFQTDDLPDAPQGDRTLAQDLRIAEIMRPDRFATTTRRQSAPAASVSVPESMPVPTYTDMLVRNIPQKIMTARSLLAAGDTAGGRREMEEVNRWASENMEELKGITRYRGADITKLTAAQWAGRLIEGTDFNEMIPFFDPRNNPNSALFIARKQGFGPSQTAALQMSLHGENDEKRELGTAILNSGSELAEAGVKGRLPASVLATVSNNPDSFAKYAISAYDGTLRGLAVPPTEALAISQRTFRLGDHNTGGAILSLVKEHVSSAKSGGDTRPIPVIANSVLSSVESFAKVFTDGGENPEAPILSVKSMAGRVIGGKAPEILSNRGAMENAATRFLADASRNRVLGVDVDTDALMGVSYAKAIGRNSADVFGPTSAEARLEDTMIRRDAYANAITATQPTTQVATRDGRTVEVPQNSDLTAFADAIRLIIAREFNRSLSVGKSADEDAIFANVENGITDLIRARMPEAFSQSGVVEASRMISGMVREATRKGETVDIRTIAERAESVLTDVTRTAINGNRGVDTREIAGNTVIDIVEKQAKPGTLSSVLAGVVKDPSIDLSRSSLFAGAGSLTNLSDTLSKKVKTLSVVTQPGFSSLVTSAASSLSMKEAKELAAISANGTSDLSDTQRANPAVKKVEASLRDSLTKQDPGFLSLPENVLQKIVADMAVSAIQNIGRQVLNGKVFGPDDSPVSMDAASITPEISSTRTSPGMFGAVPVATSESVSDRVARAIITSETDRLNKAGTRENLVSDFRGRVAAMLTPEATKYVMGSKEPVATPPPVTAGGFTLPTGDDLTRARAGAQVVKALTESLMRGTGSANYDRLADEIARGSAAQYQMDPGQVSLLISRLREKQAVGMPFSVAASDISKAFSEALKERNAREIARKNAEMKLASAEFDRRQRLKEEGL